MSHDTSQIVYAIDKEEKQGGNQSLRFTAESKSGCFPGVKQLVKITPGKAYTLNLWVKGKDLKNLADGEPAKEKTAGNMSEELRVLMSRMN